MGEGIELYFLVNSVFFRGDRLLVEELALLYLLP